MPIIHIGRQQLSYDDTGGSNPADGVAAPLRSRVSLIPLPITTVLVLRNSSANQRVKQVERERASLVRFFSPSNVDQLIGAHAPLSLARCQPAAVPFADMVGFTASEPPP